MTKASVASTRPKAKANKPAKPRKDFPLFPHASGQWAKKVLGQMHYFGVWADPVAAEKEWERQKLALLEGRDPDEAIYGETVGWLCNAFVESKALQKERSELSERSFKDYRRVAKEIATHFGKGRRLDSIRPSDFERYRNSFPDTWGPTTINSQLRLVRVLFKYANDIEVTKRPIRYSIGLKAVPKSTVRKHQATQDAKEYTADEVWRLYHESPQPMRAFILLGLNAAYGTMDIARLRIDDIDFKNHWLGVMRGKTGIARGCWLWPETLTALREAIDAKPYTTRPSLEPLAFITTHRRPWAEDGSTSHPLTMAFNKLKKAAEIDKPGVGHYALRHTFATVASGARDQQAVDYVMGHIDNTMAGNYREGIDPKRVKAVCQFVRRWFLAGKPKGGAK
ncbi:tyrosine-type recombinase/integrase [Novipirellula artificiosorum]|uniref:Transposase n=1 Tax=Novipirellula artificiosorum TaxID=2528016 RepID=A0A5C6DJD6_9BACT|nr:tyrosine-type recombinase/integrase [Novipirellula artificiosorum]TWU36017.1 Transposase [Novipirellula artificiosorum]